MDAKISSYRRQIILKKSGYAKDIEGVKDAENPIAEKSIKLLIIFHTSKYPRVI
jgi:hypothetical protein